MKKIRKFTALLICVFTVFSVLSVSAFAVAKPPAPTKASVTAVSANAARLTWSACEGVTGYRVYVYYNNAWKTVKDTKATSCVVSGLKASQNYTFAVKSLIKSNGTYYLSTNYASVKVKTNGLIAAELSGTAALDYVNLTWTKVPGASGFEVHMNDGSGWKLVLKRAKLNAKISGLTGGKTYRFAVKAYSDVNGNLVKGPVSNYLKLTTTDPNKVTVKCAAVSDSAVKLKWSKADSANGYRIYTYQDGSWVKVKDILSGDTLTYTVKNLESDTIYHYKVRAFKKTSSGVRWYQASSACKAVTNPGIKDVELYRVDKLRTLLNSECYTLSYEIINEEYGFIPVTIAKNGNEYYLRTLVNERPYVLLNKADGASYILLEENKSYIKVPVVVADLFDVRGEMEGFLPGEDWEGTASIATYNSQKVVCEEYTNSSTGKTLRFFYKAGNLIGIEESGLFGVEEGAVVQKVSSGVAVDLFDIPADYQKIFFGTADVVDFAVA